jgi:hypothetical protein
VKHALTGRRRLPASPLERLAVASCPARDGLGRTASPSSLRPGEHRDLRKAKTRRLLLRAPRAAAPYPSLGHRGLVDAAVSRETRGRARPPFARDLPRWVRQLTRWLVGGLFHVNARGRFETAPRSRACAASTANTSVEPGPTRLSPVSRETRPPTRHVSVLAKATSSSLLRTPALDLLVRIRRKPRRRTRRLT